MIPNFLLVASMATCYSSGRDELLIGFNVAAAFSLASVVSPNLSILQEPIPDTIFFH
jgi:hypothetical protein